MVSLKLSTLENNYGIFMRFTQRISTNQGQACHKYQSKHLLNPALVSQRTENLNLSMLLRINFMNISLCRLSY